MQNIPRRCTSLFFAVLFLGGFSLAQSNRFRVRKTLELGGEGGWDYVTFEDAKDRLFIARSNRVMVVDASSGKVLGEVPGTEGVHGVALVPNIGKGFASDGRSDSVTVFDSNSLNPISQISVGGIPDAIIFDPTSGRVLTFNARTHDATAIDPETAKVTGTIPLGGKPEYAAPDGSGGVYVNIEDTSELVHLNPRQFTVVQRWPIPGCEDPTGLSFDQQHERLFIGCANQKLVVMDSKSGRVVTTLPIGAGVDGTAFDAGLQMIFASTGSGTLAIIHEESPDQFTKIEDLPTAPGARTLTLDHLTHTIYVVTGKPEQGQQSSPFRVLVVSR